MCGLKRVRIDAIWHNNKIEPQGFVARGEMSASVRTAVRISYVHAGIEVLHLRQLLEIHRVFGVWEGLVNFILQALIAGGIKQQVVKSGGQRRLDRICTCNDGEGAIGKDIRDGGPLPFRTAIVNLGHDLSGTNKEIMGFVTYTHEVIVKVLGDRPAIQTFTGHIVTKISQC